MRSRSSWFLVVIVVFGLIGSISLLGMASRELENLPWPEGTVINVFTDGGINKVPWDQAAPEIQKKAGIIINVSPVAQVDVYPKLKNEFVAGTGAFDIVVYPPKYEPEFANLGNIQPLDAYTYLIDPMLDDIPVSLRELYSIYNDKLYSLPEDGDLHVLYYRKDLIENPIESKNFEARYGYKLGIPQTWKQAIDYAQFFTRKKGEQLAGKTLDDNFYGTAMMLDRLWCIYEFIDRFAAFQGTYFDENLNPGINSEAGLKALDTIKELLKYAPPDSLSYGYFETRNSFLGGKCASMLQFTDIFKFSYDVTQSVVMGKLGLSHIPGTMVNGELYYKGTMPYGRIMSVTSTCKNPAAAYWVIAYMSTVASQDFVFDTRTGEDPFRYSQINAPERLSEWLEKFSGGSKVPVAECKEYLDTIGASFKSAYPEFSLPGSKLYMDALSEYVQKALGGSLSSKEALDQCADRWNTITDQLGRKGQLEIWNRLLISWRKLGLIE